MTTIAEQSQRSLLNQLRWGGFGSIAGLLGSVLLSLDVIYAITYALSFSPGTRFVLPIYDWLAANHINFSQFILLSAIMMVISMLEPWVLMRRISSRIMEEDNRGRQIKRMLRIRNVLVIYILSASTLCLILSAVLNSLGEKGLW